MNNSFLYWLKFYKCWKCHTLIFSVVRLRSDKDLDSWSLGLHQAERDEVSEPARDARKLCLSARQEWGVCEELDGAPKL